MPEWAIPVNDFAAAEMVRILAIAWILGTLTGAITLMFSGRK